MRIAESERSKEGIEADDELLSSDVPAPLEWSLLTGPRWAVSFGLVLLFLVLLVGLLKLQLIDTANSSFLTRLFASLIASNVTLITVVISISQLIISREFSSPGRLQQDIEKAIEYKQNVSALIDSSTTPASPGAFLMFLVVLLRDEAASLRDETTPLSGEAESTVQSLTTRLTAQAEEIQETVDEPSLDHFDTLLVVLNSDFSTDLHTAHQIQAIHDHSLPTTVNSKLDVVIELLEYIGVARQHMKTLYFQRALTALSREILNVGIPAVGFLTVSILVLSGESGPTIDGMALDGVVISAVTLAIAPIAVFCTYTLRIATITRRTGAVLPFVITE